MQRGAPLWKNYPFQHMNNRPECWVPAPYYEPAILLL